MSRILLVVVLLAVMLPVPTHAQDSTASISSPSGRITISYPSDWLASNAVETDVQLALASEAIAIAKDEATFERLNSGPNVGGTHLIVAVFPTLEVYPFNPSPMNLDEVVDTLFAGVSGFTERLEISGFEAARFSVLDQPGFTIINQGASMIAISSEAENEEDLVIINNIINNLVITAPEIDLTPDSLTREISTQDERLTFPTADGWYYGSNGAISYTSPQASAIQDVTYGLLGFGPVQSPVFSIWPRSYGEFFNDPSREVTQTDIQVVLDLTLSEFGAFPDGGFETLEVDGFPAARTSFALDFNTGQAIAVDAGQTIYVVFSMYDTNQAEATAPLVDAFFEQITIEPLDPAIANLAPEGLRQGYRAPDFGTTLLDGTPISLADLRGEVVMLNFWFTTCPPCDVEMPIMQELFEEYSTEGFTILAVNNRETPDMIQPFLDERGLTFPIALDVAGNLQAQYQVAVYPTTLFLNRDGVIYGVHRGPITREQLEGFITEGLAQ